MVLKFLLIKEIELLLVQSCRLDRMNKRDGSINIHINKPSGGLSALTANFFDLYHDHGKMIK